MVSLNDPGGAGAEKKEMRGMGKGKELRFW